MTRRTLVRYLQLFVESQGFFDEDWKLTVAATPPDVR